MLESHDCLNSRVPSENHDWFLGRAKTFEGPGHVRRRDDVGMGKRKNRDPPTTANSTVGETCITGGHRLIDIGPDNTAPYRRAHSVTAPSSPQPAHHEAESSGGSAPALGYAFGSLWEAYAPS